MKPLQCVLMGWKLTIQWPLGKKKGSPLFSGTDSSLHGQRKWPRYGGSSLDGEFPAHWNTLKGFQCVSMGFLFSHYDVFILQ